MQTKVDSLFRNSVEKKFTIKALYVGENDVLIQRKPITDKTFEYQTEEILI